MKPGRNSLLVSLTFEAQVCAASITANLSPGRARNEAGHLRGGGKLPSRLNLVLERANSVRAWLKRARSVNKISRSVG